MCRIKNYLLIEWMSICCIFSVLQVNGEQVQVILDPSRSAIVNLPCPKGKVVGLDGVQTDASDSLCRAEIFLWLAEFFHGQAGSQREINPNDFASCSDASDFQVDYSCVEDSQIKYICEMRNQNISTPNAIYVASPEFPQPYATDRECTVHFNLLEFSRISVIYLDMHARSTQGCYDSIEISFFLDGYGWNFPEETLCADHEFDANNMLVTDVFETLGIKYTADEGNWQEDRERHHGFLVRVELATTGTTTSTTTTMPPATTTTSSTTSTTTSSTTSTTTSSTTSTTTTGTTSSTISSEADNESFTEAIDIARDDCIGIICQNGGTCVDDFSSYSCECRTGYAGLHCEEQTSTEPDNAATHLNSSLLSCATTIITLWTLLKQLY